MPTPGVTRPPALSPHSRRRFLKTMGIAAATLAVADRLPARGVAQDQLGAADVGLFATIYSTRAMRRLKPDPIPEETLRKIVEAGIHAPSGGNRQDWGFILVRDPELKRFIRDRYVATQQKLQKDRPPSPSCRRRGNGP